MKIQKITAQLNRVPLKTPFKTALRTATAVEEVTVRIHTACGRVGWGAAPATAAITGETVASIQQAVQGPIQSALLGRDATYFENVMAALHGSLMGNTSAKAAVDMALYDLFAQHCGLPLYQLLGGTRQRLETDLTISLNTPEQMVQDSLRAAEDGFTLLKVKLGQGDEDAELGRLRAIRAALGSAIRLRVDANQAWNPKQSVRLIRRMEDEGLCPELVEQPVPAQDIEGLAYVSAQVYTPILADESVFSPTDALRLIQRRAADLINIKLMKTGGIHKALQICALAQASGMGCMMGCMLESPLSAAAAAHLAAAHPAITLVDLDGPSLCAGNPYRGGPSFCGPNILMSETSGLGIEGFCEGQSTQGGSL